MLTLVSFPPALGEPSLSSFCTKAMILLDMAGEDWRAEFRVDTRKAPFDKLPVVEASGEVIGDSNLLIAWLETRGADLFPGLDAAARGTALAVMRMVEENLRYGMMYGRWVDPAGWAAFCPVVFGKMPAPLRLIIPGKIRSRIAKGLVWQGLGRFGAQERQAYFQRDLNALSAILGDQTWLFGDAPCAADAAILQVLSSIDGLQVDTDLRRALRADTRLMAYVTRGRAAFYAPISARTGAAA